MRGKYCLYCAKLVLIVGLDESRRKNKEYVMLEVEEIAKILPCISKCANCTLLSSKICFKTAIYIICFSMLLGYIFPNMNFAIINLIRFCMHKFSRVHRDLTMIKPVWDHKKTDGRNPDLRDAWKTTVWGSLKRKDGGHVR